MEKPRVLFVDDDPNILQSFKRQLRGRFDLETASCGRTGIERLNKSGPFAVVVSDMQMPEMNGVEFLAEAEQLAPDTIRIMLTGNVDQATATRAVNDGHVFRFLNKPCSSEEFGAALEAGVKQYQLITAERDLLQKTLSGSVKVLTDILTLMDPVAFGDSLSSRGVIREYAKVFDIANRWELELAAMLRTIGKVALPKNVLDKLNSKQSLTEDERKLFEQIPQTSHNLLQNIPRLEHVAKTILYLEKNYDGSGFPNDACKGEEIPREACALRILIDWQEACRSGQSELAVVQAMLQKTGCYDPEMLQKLAASLTGEDASAETKVQQYKISLNDLCPGQILLNDVRTSDDVLLVAAGNEVTEVLIQRICNYAEHVGVQLPLTVDSLMPTESRSE